MTCRASTLSLAFIIFFFVRSVVGEDHSRTMYFCGYSYTVLLVWLSNVVLLSPLSCVLLRVASLQIQWYSCCLSQLSLSLAERGGLVSMSIVNDLLL